MPNLTVRVQYQRHIPTGITAGTYQCGGMSLPADKAAIVVDGVLHLYRQDSSSGSPKLVALIPLANALDVTITHNPA